MCIPFHGRLVTVLLRHASPLQRPRTPRTPRPQPCLSCVCDPQLRMPILFSGLDRCESASRSLKPPAQAVWVCSSRPLTQAAGHDQRVDCELHGRKAAQQHVDATRVAATRVAALPLLPEPAGAASSRRSVDASCSRRALHSRCARVALSLRSCRTLVALALPSLFVVFVFVCFISVSCEPLSIHVNAIVVI